MIPEVAFEPEPELPAEAVFWLPPPRWDGEDDVSLGNFHDTWSIRDVPVAVGFEILRTELTLVRLLDEAARTPGEFEMLAAAVEYPEVGNADRGEFGHVSEDLLDWITSDVPPELGGLELGVAGLVHVLAGYGCVPAASCRGHVYDPPRRPWSDGPVVYFASGRERAESLVPLVRSSGCGFSTDSERPKLLVIEAPSIIHMLRLAERILLSMPSGLSAEHRAQLSESRNGPGDRNQTALW